MDIDIDNDDGLSTALGTESLAARDMVPEGFDNTPRARGALEQLIQGRRYLRVDQSANKRNNSKVSKIWCYGSELRALDTTNLDKHWLCNLCLPAKLRDDIIEALECLKAWFDKGLIEKEESVH